MRALDRKLLRDLWRLRSQVITIALVVASGVGGYIGSLSAHASLAGMRDRYYESARFAHVFAPVRRAPRELAGRLRNLPGVLDIDMSIQAPTTLTVPGSIEVMTGLIVSLPRRPDAGMNRVVLERGRWVEPDEANGVLVSKSFANARGIAPGDRLSLLMNGRYQEVRVNGIALSPAFVFAAAQGGFADDTRFGVLWMPEERLAAAYDLRGAFNLLSVRLASGADAPRVIDALERVLAPYGAVGAYARKDQLSHKILTQEIDEQRVFGTVLPAVFLAVAIFLLHVLISRHIATERTQIAALKAMGYADREVGVHYFAFTAVTVVAGVLLGIGVGYAFGHWMTGLYTRVFSFPHAQFSLVPWVVVSAVLLAALAGSAAALQSVRAVVRLPAAEAMRPPAPARFRRTLLERAGLGKLLNAPVRMVMRELERRPLRTVLTTLGIASSVAIIIAGTWWTGAFDYLVDQELFRRDRANVLIALNEPRAIGGLAAIRRMPGVLTAEATRTVAVRLRHGAREYRTVLMGIDPGARMRRVLDPQDRELPLAANSLFLTDRLAHLLGVRSGDVVEIEPLEGTREPHRMHVSAETGDLMGMYGYLTRRDAARLVGEGDTFNLARVRLDPAADAAFFDAVRATPAIAAAGDKRRMVAHFRATSQHNLLMFATILSAFAMCIAVGVVYNSARITLAEQAWELATLRVMGFTRAEVSWTLLGQLGAQMLVALPIGWLAGTGLAALILKLISSEEFRIPLVIDSFTYTLASLVMLGAGLVTAIVVRRRIDRLDLIGVLKTRD
ncbi:MAG TPA: ABC transporter permease [Steroidobacteraceae bacterium]|nr:ABC transporter permease [Steroidobacteraceae bacterium]